MEKWETLAKDCGRWRIVYSASLDAGESRIREEATAKTEKRKAAGNVRPMSVFVLAAVVIGVRELGSLATREGVEISADVMESDCV